MQLQLQNGYLLVLPREAAKSFFGCRTDEDRWEFLRGWLTSEEAETVDCQGIWRRLHDLLTAQSEGSALDQCLLGGRPMHKDDDALLFLVRPDVVRAVAAECQKPSCDLLQWEGNGKSHEDLVRVTLQRIAQLYSSAAAQGAAVVFFAQEGEVAPGA